MVITVARISTFLVLLQLIRLKARAPLNTTYSPIRGASKTRASCRTTTGRAARV